MLESRPARGVSPRSVVLVGIAVGAAVAVWWLSRVPGALAVSRGGLELAAAFLARAVTPALTYETAVPQGTAPLIWKTIMAAEATVTFAAAAMSLALVAGSLLAFGATSAWWAPDGRTTAPRPVVHTVVWGTTRAVTAFARAIHELFWAVLLLAAFGVSHLAAVLAIAIPYSGILAKVFSELIDEAPREPALALRDAGASPLQAFLFGLLPRALPDMVAYAFYRFECAIRSSAVLGFFGFPTLGYFIAASFENVHYGEVWTYLYALFALVLVFDWWSGALRRRFVS